MNKNEFLTELASRLCGLPEEDISKTTDYYSEIIDDYMEDGLLEQDAVAAVGSINDAVNQTLAETPMPKLVKQKIKPNRVLKAWEIVLLILGSPVWLPILISIVAILLSVYAIIWSVVVCLYAGVIAFFSGFIAGFFSSFVFLSTGKIAEAMTVLGLGLVCGGLTVFGFAGCNQAVKGLIWLSKKIWLGIKSSFVGKGSAK